MSAENNPTTTTSTAEEVKKQFTDEQLQHEVPCRTKDGDTINTVPVKNALLLQSDLYSTMAKNLFLSDTNAKLDDFEFPVNSIPTDVFQLVVEWLEEHDGKPNLVIEEDPNTKERKWFEISPFEEAFFKKLDVEQLAAVINAARFLQIDSLYHGGCQAFAKLLKDKSPEQICELLELEDDLTEEEKAAIRAKNVWCSY